MDWRWEQHDTGISWHFSIYMHYRKDKNNMKNLSLCRVEVVTKDGKKPLQCFWPSNFQKQSLAPRKSRKISALYLSISQHSWALGFNLHWNEMEISISKPSADRARMGPFTTGVNKSGTGTGFTPGRTWSGGRRPGTPWKFMEWIKELSQDIPS